jgi:predicted glycoside hydrolase/deacetylase ChbG (UPF0249 family)
MTRVIFSADDFALNAAVNRAVVELADRGRLTATACLVLAPRWPRSAALLRDRTDLDVGLHLDFTEFDALGSLPRLAAAARLRQLPEHAVRDRIRRQFDRFEDTLGRSPDYVDGHQHVHQFPQIAGALLEEIRRRDPRPRPWWRRSAAPLSAGVKGLALRLLAERHLARRVAGAGLPASHRLLGVYRFDRDADGWRRLLDRALRAARDGDALMLHPAVDALPGDPIGPARRVEYGVLEAADLGPALSALGIVPVRGTQCLIATAC